MPGEALATHGLTHAVLAEQREQLGFSGVRYPVQHGIHHRRALGGYARRCLGVQVQGRGSGILDEVLFLMHFVVLAHPCDIWEAWQAVLRVLQLIELFLQGEIFLLQSGDRSCQMSLLQNGARDDGRALSRLFLVLLL